MKKETTRKTCLKCGHEFTHRERLQSLYRIFYRMYCKECGTRYSVLPRYRLVFASLIALPVAFGPSLYDYMGWGLWNELIFAILYFGFLSLIGLLVVPILPLKWDPAEVTETSTVEKEGE